MAEETFIKKFVNVMEWQDRAESILKRMKEELPVYPTGIFGVPRGGTPLAVYIALQLDVPILAEPRQGCVVVDDLIDSGTTRLKYPTYPFYALIDKKAEGLEGVWIEFWYENTESDDKDLALRIIQRLGVDLKSSSSDLKPMEKK